MTVDPALAFISQPRAVPGTVTLLELRGVNKTYLGDVAALSDIDLVVSSGELVAILGPSGSGKTTLLHVMGTLDRASGGVVRIAGREVNEMSESELAGLRAGQIGFVFQQFFLLDGLSALENTAMGALYSGLPRKERLALARSALERVGLSHRLTHAPGELSGGEKQRVAIARALLNDPKIVFADEPTGNLDTSSSDGIVELLHDLRQDGTTIIVITHDRDIAARFPRRVEMRDGRIVADERGSR